MASFEWNELDSRACVPSPSQKASLDVLRGSVAGVIDSRSPFSVGVYVAERGNHFRALDLLYVSKAVADDRARTSPPMPAGWYLPIGKNGDMGHNFEIRVTARCNKIIDTFRRELPGADIAVQRIEVDGHDSKPGGYSLDPACCIRRGKLPCTRYRGFTESFSATSVAHGSRTVRSFCFGKPQVTESKGNGFADDDDRADFGVIELVVQSARKGPEIIGPVRKITATAPKCVDVTERSAMKKGATVALKQDGESISENVASVSYSVVSAKLASELGIRIYVRERNWLMSRRIVDSSGQPCTASMAQAMENDNSSRVASSRPLKKIKADPTEVIDLL